jgi:hypothetical protein
MNQSVFVIPNETDPGHGRRNAALSQPGYFKITRRKEKQYYYKSGLFIIMLTNLYWATGKKKYSCSRR